MKIFVKAKPGAKQNKVIKIDETHFNVFVSAIAEKGKANKKIIKLLAKHFNTSVSNVIILSGEKIKEKIIQIN